jgi:hypothetical protein
MSPLNSPKKADPVIVDSKHSCRFQRDGNTVEVAIYRLADGHEWSLEVINESGTSTVWNDTFDSDDAAWTAFIDVINAEGIASLVTPSNATPSH